jgi:hypothetical protein
MGSNRFKDGPPFDPIQISLTQFVTNSREKKMDRCLKKNVLPFFRHLGLGWFGPCLLLLNQGPML